MKKAFLAVIILFFNFSMFRSSVFCQSIDESAKEIESFYAENFLETVYVHTDKSYYLTGELIRFKVYCLEKITSKPSQLSKVAYVELLDENNIPTIQARIELENGTGYGEMYIPTSVNSGNMILRAYTRWMRNYGPETFFHSMLTVINPFKRLGLKPLTIPENADISFYPEGGSLIRGIKTKVVFECKDEKGYPIDATGRLYANDSLLVQEFKTAKIGLGSFSFTPEEQTNYMIELIQNDGTVTKQDLPDIKNKGLSFQVVENGNAYQCELICTDASLIKSYDLFRFLLLQKGKIIVQKNLTLNQSKATFEFQKELVKEGVSSIIMLDATGKVLHERKIFKYTGIVDAEKIVTKKNRFEEREKVIAEVPLLDRANDLSRPDFSFSVAAFNKKFEFNTLNFEDYILLDNTLQFVYGLESCFQGTPTQTAELINDLLIIYPGTSVWQNSLKNPEYIPEYRGPLLTAQIVNRQTNNPASSVITYLSVPGEQPQFYASRSDSKGVTAFELKDFYGKREVVLQTNYTKDTVYSIVADNPFSEVYLTVNIPDFDLDESMENWIKHQSENMQVENAYLKYKPILPSLNKIDSTNFYNEPDAKYNLDDFTRFIVMEEVMREYIRGVNVRKNRDGYHFMVLDVQKNIIYNREPLMLLDGVPVFDADEIIELDPLKVASIETINMTYFKGILENSGIVNYATYKGDLDGYTLHKDALVFEYEGVQARKEYYFPKYATPKEKNAKTPDFRNTLYWNPNITENRNQKSAQEFYTSDDDNQYELKVEGIDKNGHVFSAKSFIEVQK